MIDVTKARPREIEAYLREVIRKTFGDKVENASRVYASRGYYRIHIELPNTKYIDFDHFRRGEVPKIAKAIRAFK